MTGLGVLSFASNRDMLLGVGVCVFEGSSSLMSASVSGPINSRGSAVEVGVVIVLAESSHSDSRYGRIEAGVCIELKET